MNLKNIAKGSTESFTVDDGVILLKQTNDNEFASNFNYNISKDYIQFHFCLKGTSKFLFNQGSYVFNVENENSILLYNPCLLYTSPSPRDRTRSRMPSSA